MIKINTDEPNQQIPPEKQNDFKSDLQKYVTQDIITINNTTQNALYFNNKEIATMYVNWILVYDALNLKLMNRYLTKILYCILTNSVYLPDTSECYNLDENKIIKIKYYNNGSISIHPSDTCIIFKFNKKDYKIYLATNDTDKKIKIHHPSVLLYPIIFEGNINNIQKDYKCLSDTHKKDTLMNKLAKYTNKINKLQTKITQLNKK